MQQTCVELLDKATASVSSRVQGKTLQDSHYSPFLQALTNCSRESVSKRWNDEAFPQSGIPFPIPPHFSLLQQQLQATCKNATCQCLISHFPYHSSPQQQLRVTCKNAACKHLVVVVSHFPYHSSPQQQLRKNATCQCLISHFPYHSSPQQQL